MATVLPFKALRPSRDKVHLVVSRSMDGYQVTELKDKLAGNPYTFLHVINPDYDDGIKTRPGSPERLEKIKGKFKTFVDEKILVLDETPSYYVYRQIKNGIEYIGIMACTSIDDYMNGVIKVHEQTITQREVKLKEYLDVCEFNADPVLFCYPNDAVLDAIITETAESDPEYDFTTTDKLRHSLWVIKDAEQVETISKRFKKMPHIYIADGHHRSASSALLGNERRAVAGSFTGNEAYNYYLGVFFSETQLKIYDYNRFVKDMEQVKLPDLLQQLDEKFEVTEVKAKLFKPSQKHEISMYVSGKWYSLMARPGTFNAADPVGSLDASVLTEHILAPMFGIHDLKIDKRIGFIPGIRGAEALKKTVDEGKGEVAFGLYPVTMEHLKWIADTQNIMPPKSTWVEPKIRSGLVVYSFND